MSTSGVFLTDITLTAMLCMGMLAYLNRHLRPLLIELCGTRERTRFWLAFSNITLVLIPLILALDYKPQMGPDRSVIFEMATQLKCALIGFVVTLGAIALVLSSFIRRANPAAPGDAVR